MTYSSLTQDLKDWMENDGTEFSNETDNFIGLAQRTSFIDQLIDQSDIVDVIGRRLQLNKKGSRFWCLCPFHDDSRPSMAVNQDKQFFYCFVCQESGNAIHFLRKYEHLEKTVI